MYLLSVVLKADLISDIRTVKLKALGFLRGLLWFSANLVEPAERVMFWLLLAKNDTFRRE